MGSRDQVVFVQYSSRFLAPDDLYWDYYRHAYARMPGYVLPEHYMEIPHWIPQITAILPESVDKRLYIVTDQDELVRFAARTPADAVFLFSVMNCNLEYVVDFAKRVDRAVVAGGYVDPNSLAELPNVTILRSTTELPKVFPGSMPSRPANYALFHGQRCIPRFRLSDGCGFGCYFCSVAPDLQLLAPERLPEEVEALRPLDFDLVYISDKSFGEAPNWTSLSDVRDRVAAMRPSFVGFTVQTTPAIACQDGMLARWRDLGVRYVEVGLEICDDDQLARLGKPFRMHQMNTTARLARELELKIISDLIFGIPEADYGDRHMGPRPHRPRPRDQRQLAFLRTPPPWRPRPTHRQLGRPGPDLRSQNMARRG